MRNESAERRKIYYGWYIVAAAFLLIFLNSTLRNSFGIFFKPIQQEFGWSRAALSLPVSLALILYGVAQPIAGLLVGRFGARSVLLSGSIFVVVGTLTMSQVDSLLGIYIFYGIVLGLGSGGISFTSVTPLLSDWFHERRGMAFSFASAGTSVGQLLGLPLLALLLASAGWRSTYAWVGLICLLSMIPVSVFVVRNRPGSADLDAGKPSEKAAARSIARSVPYNLPWVDCMQKAPFLLLLTSFFTCGFTITVMAVHWIPFATDVGFSVTVATTAFAVGGGLNTIGTLVVGPLSDRMGRKIPLSLVYLFRGLGFLLFIPFKNDLTVWAVPMMIGLSWIATVPLTSALTGDFFGPRNVGVLFGLIQLSHQMGSGLGAWLSGYIYDATGSYNLAFALAAYLCVQAAVLVSLIKEKETHAAPPSAAPGAA